MNARRWMVGAVLLAGLLPCLAAAQSSMTFRPVPADSVREVVRGARDRARARLEAARDDAQAALDSLEEGLAGADVPEPPDVPLPPDDLGRRSTTGDVLKLGSDVHVGPDEVIVGDVVDLGGDIQVQGSVQGSVIAFGGDVELAPSARIDGDVVTLGGTLHELPGSVVRGQRVTTAGPRFGHVFWPMLGVIGTGYKVAIGLFGLLLSMGIAWLVVKLAPHRTEAALATIEREAGASFLIGLLVWGLLVPSVVVLALVIALLCITLIGIPLAAAVAVGYCAVLALLVIWGGVAGGTFIGLRLRDRLRPGPYSLVAGAIWGVIAIQGLKIVGDLLGVVPVFGFLGVMVKVVHVVAFWVITTIGMGALIRTEYRSGTVQAWWRRIRPMTPPRAGTAHAGPVPAGAAGFQAEQAPPPPEPPAPSAG